MDSWRNASIIPGAFLGFCDSASPEATALLSAARVRHPCALLGRWSTWDDIAEEYYWEYVVIDGPLVCGGPR